MKIKAISAAPVLGILIAAAFFGSSTTDCSAQGESAAKLLADVKESARSYGLLASKLQARSTRHSKISAPVFEQTVVTTVKHNASSALRWDQRRDSKGEVSFEAVSCRNNKYAFTIRKKKGKNWFLDELVFDAPQKLKWEGSSKTIDDAVIEVIAPQFTGFVVGTPSLTELFARKEFKLASSPQPRRAGRDLPGLDFQYTGTHGKSSHTQEGVMIFAPDKNWGQQRVEYHYEGPEGTGETVIEFQYDGKLDKFAKPSKLSRTAKMTRKGGEVSLTTAVTTFELWLDETIPDTEFTLSAFGLPEPKGITWESRSASWLWLGLTGVALVSGGFLLRHKLRARSVPPPV